MNSKRGLTLVEIVVAVGLLGIIAVLFLTAFSGQFSMFSRTRQITDNLFQSQEIIEKDIDNIKTKLVENPSAISNTTISYNLFSGIYARQVSGYISDTRSHSEDTRLVVVVSDGRLPAFPVPEIGEISLKIDRGSGPSDDLLDNFENVSYSVLSLKSTSSITDPLGVYYTSRHEWYVSNPGFNIPVISRRNLNYDILVNPDFDLGRLYPVFPNDYSPVPISAYTGMSFDSVLSTLAETYAGRHVVYKITPYAASGKMGESAVSDPIFLTGPSVIDGRLLHLDASLISKADYGSGESSLLASNSNKVKMWKDSSGTGNNAIQVNSDMMPRVSEVNYNDVSSVWGRALSGESTGSDLSISSFVNGDALSNYTVIITAKRLNNSSYNFLTARNGVMDVWNIGYLDGDLVFDSTAGVPANRNISADDSWHIYTFDIKSDGSVSLYIDDETSPSAGGIITAGHSIDNLSINLSDSFELAEIIMYKDLTSNNMLKVKEFLNDKYHPDPAEHAVTINYLLPVSDQILVKGDPGPGLPGSVLAHMTNGSVQSVAVIWDGGYDPDTVGTFSLTGRAVMDSSKTVTTTVHVLGIDGINISPASVSMYEGNDYPLPVRLPATVSNSSISRTLDVLVNWFNITSGLPGSSISNLSTLGVSSGTPHTIRAYADADSTKYADLSVTIDIWNSVDGVSLSNSSMTIRLGETDSLVATVSPANATNKNLYWNSSNPASVKIVDTATPGTVQLEALAAGDSIITVTTEDGGFTANCAISVHVPLTGLSFPQASISMRRNITYDVSDDLVFAPDNASDKRVLWSSTNANVITVNSSGVVSSHNNGTANLIAKSVENNSIVAGIEISVSGNSGCG